MMGEDKGVVVWLGKKEKAQRMCKKKKDQRVKEQLYYVLYRRQGAEIRYRRQGKASEFILVNTSDTQRGLASRCIFMNSYVYV